MRKLEQERKAIHKDSAKKENEAKSMVPSDIDVNNSSIGGNPLYQALKILFINVIIGFLVAIGFLKGYVVLTLLLLIIADIVALSILCYVLSAEGKYRQEYDDNSIPQNSDEVK